MNNTCIHCSYPISSSNLISYGCENNHKSHATCAAYGIGHNPDCCSQKRETFERLVKNSWRSGYLTGFRHIPNKFVRMVSQPKVVVGLAVTLTAATLALQNTDLGMVGRALNVIRNPVVSVSCAYLFQQGFARRDGLGDRLIRTGCGLVGGVGSIAYNVAKQFFGIASQPSDTVVAPRPTNPHQCGDDDGEITEEEDDLVEEAPETDEEFAHVSSHLDETDDENE
jgi:hypothetical protein